MDDDEFYAMSADARIKYVQERRKKRKGGGKGGNEPLTKGQIQEITTDAGATTISAIITVDPRDQEEGPSVNAGDSFGGKRNQIQHKIMKLKSSAAASMAQNKKMVMDSLEIN